MKIRRISSVIKSYSGKSKTFEKVTITLSLEHPVNYFLIVLTTIINTNVFPEQIIDFIRMVTFAQ